ncbi:MAG: malectin domain-containing carbohydrate-binding protein, partial [Bacteroidota bacterium]
MEVTLEDQGSPTSTSYDIPGIEQAFGVDIFISVDPAANTAQPFISLDGGNSVITLGSPITLPASFLDPNDDQGLAIGIIATSRGPGAAFGASWDFFTVTENQPGLLGVSPNALNFDPIVEGGNPGALNLDISNLGSPTDGPVIISALNVSGPDASLFSTATNTPVSIAGGDNILVPVTFTPDNTPGTKSATLSIVHSGANSPLQVPLTAEVLADLVPLVRINAGGVEVIATDAGPNWQANTDLNGGASFTVSSPSNEVFSLFVPASGRDASVPTYIDDVTYETLFETERFDGPGGEELQYFIPLSNDDYIVKLYLVNSWPGTSGPGERIFGISIEDQVVESTLDLITTFGHQVGGVLEYP